LDPERPTDSRVPEVDVVVPVYNEEKILPQSIATLVDFLRTSFRGSFRIVIADNASVDGTQEVGTALAARFEEVEYRRLPRKGRGWALWTTWTESPAAFVTYMDVDLSTNLAAFPEMVGKLRDGSDVVIGSRLRRGADTTRSLKREILSRGYNLLVRSVFGTRFSDAQCGFKGARRDAVQLLVPFVADRKWFFDTELLVLAEKTGHAVQEVPVKWIEDLDSRVELLRTIRDDLVSLVRLRRDLSTTLERIRAARRVERGA
jgi:glycosyltransferase involved in cell wall biosynthesis